MSDLRERLADAVTDAVISRRADRALAVFAAWLRERAGEMYTQARRAKAVDGRFDLAERVAWLADEIEPKGSDRG